MSHLLPPNRIIKVYIEALAGFSYVYCPGGLNNTLLSQGCVLDKAPTVGMVGRMHMLRTEGAAGCPGPAHRSHPLDNLLQHQILLEKELETGGESGIGGRSRIEYIFS